MDEANEERRKDMQREFLAIKEQILSLVVSIEKDLSAHHTAIISLREDTKEILHLLNGNGQKGLKMNVALLQDLNIKQRLDRTDRILLIGFGILIAIKALPSLKDILLLIGGS